MLARFSAAINCFGRGGPCAVPIKVLNNNAGGAEIAELLPTSAPFDSSGTDGEESHTIARSLTLPAGDYDFPGTALGRQFRSRSDDISDRRVALHR